VILYHELICNLCAEQDCDFRQKMSMTCHFFCWVLHTHLFNIKIGGTEQFVFITSNVLEMFIGRLVAAITGGVSWDIDRNEKKGLCRMAQALN
jgi:hypothetical protein